MVRFGSNASEKGVSKTSLELGSKLTPEEARQLFLQSRAMVTNLLLLKDLFDEVEKEKQDTFSQTSESQISAREKTKEKEEITQAEPSIIIDGSIGRDLIQLPRGNSPETLETQAQIGSLQKQFQNLLNDYPLLKSVFDVDGLLKKVKKLAQGLRNNAIQAKLVEETVDQWLDKSKLKEVVSKDGLLQMLNIKNYDPVQESLSQMVKQLSSIFLTPEKEDDLFEVEYTPVNLLQALTLDKSNASEQKP